MAINMKMLKTLSCKSAFVCIFTLIASCGTINYNGEGKTGFLSDYSNLKPMNNTPGTLVWQWRAENLALNNYRTLYIEPLIFYPEPNVQDQVSRNVLNELRESTDEVLRETARNQGVILTSEKGPQVLILRSAITSAEIELKNFSLIELVPIRLLFSGAELALGEREREFVLLFEYELLDSNTEKVLIRGLQYTPGIRLNSDKDQVTREDTKLVLEKIVRYLDQNFKNLASQLIP